MCGICGFYIHSDGQALDHNVLVRMRDSMTHRGPDDAGTFISPDRRVGLANRRLSILDLSAQGHQPMGSDDESIWIVYNGESYNFRELKSELTASGYEFRSGTDTEVLLHLYRKFGPDMVHRLRGMFAFAIWDKAANKLFLARDRLGVKPLYYTHTNGCFVFASEIKAILQSGLIKPALNRNALLQFLNYGKVLPPLTLFQGILKLEPGHTLTLDGNNQLCKQCYWDVPVHSTRLRHDEPAIIDQILEKLRESVRLRLVSDVPVGVFLSGGVDSSLVAALSAEEKVPLKTFTLGFEGYDRLNEFVYARQVAKLLGAEHHEVVISASDVMAFFPRFLDFQEEPVSNPIWMATYFVSTLAREHGVKVVLSGDGGDELFAGYHKWMQYLKLYHRLWRFYAYLPRAVRQVNYSICSSILYEPRIEGLLKAASCGEELFQGGTAFKRNELEILLTSDFLDDQAQQPAYTAIELLRNRYDRTAQPQSDYLNWMTYAALKTELLEDYLMRLDKMGMAASIEGREPFLDHEFVELALSIPPEFKYRNYEQKSLLKKAAARLLPKELVYRRKQGFCAPLADWLLGNMKPYLEHALLSLTASHPEIFRKEGLRTLYSRFQLGQGNPEAFWSLINFALWHRRWIENSQATMG